MFCHSSGNFLFLYLNLKVYSFIFLLVALIDKAVIIDLYATMTNLFQWAVGQSILLKGFGCFCFVCFFLLRN